MYGCDRASCRPSAASAVWTSGSTASNNLDRYLEKRYNYSSLLWMVYFVLVFLLLFLYSTLNLFSSFWWRISCPGPLVLAAMFLTGTCFVTGDFSSCFIGMFCNFTLLLDSPCSFGDFVERCLNTMNRWDKGARRKSYAEKQDAIKHDTYITLIMECCMYGHHI